MTDSPSYDEVLEARRVVSILRREAEEERGEKDQFTQSLLEAKLVLAVVIGDRWPKKFLEAIESQ